ncbi:MAG: ROK family protein, partial [Vulcanimicrobiaceae bacterium]
MEVIGVNVGGTSSTVVRGDDSGTILERRSFPTKPARGPEFIYGDIVAAVRELRTGTTGALGVAIGGPLDARRGVVIGTPHLPFRNFPFYERLHEEFALPTRIHHDAAACAMAEWLWGPYAGADGLAYLTCGTGFGVGLMLDGRLRYGSNGHSPEIGHVRYREGGPDIFEKPGCFEGYGSATALTLLAKERYPAKLGDLSPAEIAELSRRGDAGAAEIVRDNQRAVGAACAMLADLLVLDVIVLGSLARYLGDTWIEAVRATFESEALPQNARQCRLTAPMADVQD